MPRKTTIFDDDCYSEKLGQQANSVSPDYDMPEVFSIGKFGNDLSDSSQLKYLQDEIRMLEIQSRWNAIIERLQTAKEKLRLVQSRMPQQSLTSSDKLNHESDESDKPHYMAQEIGPLESFHLCKTELAHFDGKPAQYWSFMCDFLRFVYGRILLRFVNSVKFS